MVTFLIPVGTVLFINLNGVKNRKKLNSYKSRITKLEPDESMASDNDKKLLLKEEEKEKDYLEL